MKGRHQGYFRRNANGPGEISSALQFQRNPHRNASKSDHDLRLNDLDLGSEIGQASLHFFGCRLLFPELPFRVSDSISIRSQYTRHYAQSPWSR